MADISENLSSETASEVDSVREVEQLKKLEAALFLSARWLDLKELITLTDINPILIRQLIDKLRERYDEKSAISIIEKDNAWKMDVKQEHVKMINTLATGNAEFTKSEQETLAVIAYKQPVKQSVIIKIRGNKAYEHVKNFVSLGLIRAKKAGHTLQLELSEEFHDYFHTGKPEFEENKEEKDAEQIAENKSQ